MRHIAISGGTGFVGRFIVDRLLKNADTDVTLIGRHPPSTNEFDGKFGFRAFSLGDPRVPPGLFAGIDAFVHAAFSHEPGKYRGGEGDDPGGFAARNLNGSVRLFKAAKNADVKRVIFMSSRAIYGAQTPGLKLCETTPPAPDTLYGRVKLDTEARLAELAGPDFLPVSVRATGVYGPPSKSGNHKWAGLFEQFDNGTPIAPRVGTEVHGDDLAKAVDLLLGLDAQQLTCDDYNKLPVFNVSDILLDRHDLLKSYAQSAGVPDPALPPRVDASTYHQMDCTRMMKLGWKPRGKLDLSWLADDSH